MRVAVLAFLALTGCTSLIAGNIGTDLSAVRLGASQAEVEEKLGRNGKEGRDDLGRVVFTYSYKPADPGDQRRAAKYKKFERTTSNISRFGPYSYSTSTGKSGRGFVGMIFALPLIAAQGVTSAVELTRAVTRKSGQVVVVYHDDVVVDYRIHPPPPRSPPRERTPDVSVDADVDVTARWGKVRRGFDRR